jgi:branched-chain amino acid transport system permease protein
MTQAAALLVRWRWIALAIAALLALPFAEQVLPREWRIGVLLPKIFAFAIIGQGLNAITGFAGQLNLGISAFVAIGAYAFSMLTSPIYPVGLGFWPALALSAVVAAGVGVLLAVPTLRLRGDYLAIVTLGFSEIVQDSLKNLEPITKGTAGINPVAEPAFGTGLGAYLLYLALLLAAVLLLRNLRWSRLGRQWVAVREDELAARSSGIDTARAKLAAFAWGSGLAGAGGALLVASIGTSGDPGTYDFQMSVMVLCAVIVGGMGSIGGVLLGSLVMFGLNDIVLDRLTVLIQRHGGGGDVLTTPNNWKYLVFGVALILTMRLKPAGLWPAREVQAELEADARAVQP